MLRDEQSSEQRIERLLSRRHSGFSVHDRVRVDVADARGLEALARHLIRSPLSLTRMRFALEEAEVI